MSESNPAVPKNNVQEANAEDAHRKYGFVPEGLENRFGVPHKDDELARRALQENWKSINSPSGLPNEKPWPAGEVDFTMVDDKVDWLREIPTDTFPELKAVNEEIARRRT
jgi:hypothetical protein